MPFGFGKKKEENVEKPDGTYYARYLGGHKRYPADTDTTVRIYKDRIDVAPLGFIIPYSAFKDIKNVSAEENVDFNRFLSVGIIGLLRNKRLRVTAIEYTDEIDTHTILLDFGPNLKYVQPVLFERMVRSRPLQTTISSEFTIKSDKPALLLSVEVRNPVITPGNQQKIIVNVSDEKSNEKVVGAKVNGEITYPSGSRVLLEEDTSDNNGQISYSWEITNDYQLGNYNVILRATANGYKLSTITTTFEVRS